MLDFKKYGMKIKLKQITCIIGPESSGKTTIFKLLSNKINNESVYLDKKKLNDYKIDFLKKNVITIMDFERFKTEYVKEELGYFLKKLKISDNEISSRIANFTHYFHIEDIVDLKLEYLNVEELCFVKILSFLIINPTILGIDNLFSYLSKEKVDDIVDYIRENKISLIYTSTNPEYLDYADEIKVIYKFRLVKSGSKEEIFNDKVMKELKLVKPFLREINEYLKDYELVKDDFSSINECVGALWK